MSDLIAELEAFVRLDEAAVEKSYYDGIDARERRDESAVEFLRAHHAEIAAAVRDAKRYGWLRDRLAGADHVLELVGYNHDMYPGLRGEVDEAIDEQIAAMRAGEGEG